MYVQSVSFLPCFCSFFAHPAANYVFPDGMDRIGQKEGSGQFPTVVE